MLSLFEEARQWRQKAEEARTVADHMGDANARATMLNLASMCDRLAELDSQHEDATVQAEGRRV